MLDDSNLLYDWWKSLQQLDMTKVEHLINIHPHLVWARMIDPVFQPVGYDAFMETFGGDLGLGLDDLPSLHWLLFYYHSQVDVKALVLDLLNKISVEDMTINEVWGNQRNTLLHLISALGYDDLARILLEKGVSADIPNSLGRLPRHVARTNSMVKLLDINPGNKKSSKIVDDGLDSPLPSKTHSNTFSSNRSPQLLPSSSANMDTASSTIEVTTIKKPNKDGHYFRAGHVEETKQKVLTDEQVELQKQRERRRKDIAQLAKRSAVKNNPFVKKSEPSLAQTSSRHGLMAASSATSSDNTAANDTATCTSSSNTTALDKKHKRNSKVINSLQTKSYVSSSIFRQGEPSGGNSLRQYLVQSQDKLRDHDSSNATTQPSDNPTLEHLPGSRPPSSAALEIPLMASNTISDTKDSDRGSDDGNNGEQHTNVTDIHLNGSNGATEMEHSHGRNPSMPENSSSPSASLSPSPSSSSASLASASTSVSLSTTSSTCEDPLADEHISTNHGTQANTDLVTSTSANISTTPIPPRDASKDASSRAKNISNKRQSGSQKTHWFKELSTLNREFDLEKVGNQPLSTTDLDSGTAKVSLKKNKDTGGVLDKIENGKGLESGGLSEDHHRARNNKTTTLDGRQQFNTHDLDDENRRQGGNGTMFESSRLPLKSYGSVSVKSMSTYTRRLPTFDTPAEITKGNDSPSILSQFDNSLNTDTGGISTTTTAAPAAAAATTSRSSDHRRQHSNHNGDREMTRSASVLNASSSSLHIASGSKYHLQTKNGSLTVPAYLAPNTKSNIANNNNNIKSGRGKLYIRVHGVNDILLPLPRDRAHVRCVIGDGRYEYMSRYETLGQDMKFGYECIIDCQPDMIVTLSLHVRPDYMLKKPLTRLFSTTRKRKGSLSAYVSSEDGAVGQTRFAVGDMLGACHRRSYSANFHCFNAWYIHPREKSSSTSASSASSLLSISSSSRQQEQDGVLKVIGNFDVELLYLPVSDPSLPVPKNLRECDMAIKMQHWNETRFDTDHYPKIQRPPPRLAQEKSLWSVDQ